MNAQSDIWQQFCSFPNLYLAYKKARRGKADRTDITSFALDLEQLLFLLQQQLQEQSYRPGSYRQFTIYERKPRVISVAPFRDRVVHHAIMNLLEPLMDERFIEHSYACRKQRGVHAAVDYYQHCSRRFAYVVKLDIRQYFNSIDHQVLKQQLLSLAVPGTLLQVLEYVIDGSPASAVAPVYFPGDDLLTASLRGRGLPIGNLTSQWLANFYLNDLDHRFTASVGAYLRYVDDIFIFGDNKPQLWQTVTQMEQKLEELRLQLHPRKINLYLTTRRVDVLGYLLSRNRRWLRNDNGWRFSRKLNGWASACQDGRSLMGEFRPNVMSWIGHAMHGETKGLRREIFSNVRFTAAQASARLARGAGHS